MTNLTFPSDHPKSIEKNNEVNEQVNMEEKKIKKQK